MNLWEALCPLRNLNPIMTSSEKGKRYIKPQSYVSFSITIWSPAFFAPSWLRGLLQSDELEEVANPPSPSQHGTRFGMQLHHTLDPHVLVLSFCQHVALRINGQFRDFALLPRGTMARKKGVEKI